MTFTGLDQEESEAEEEDEDEIKANGTNGRGTYLFYLHSKWPHFNSIY